MLHQHTVALASPERRQIAKVCPQPTTGMRGGEVAQAGSQRKVVFGVKDMQSHLRFTDLRFTILSDSGAKIVLFCTQRAQRTLKKHKFRTLYVISRYFFVILHSI
jgi:hypothetical protein